MRISSIVAMGRNRVIGANGRMIWHIPSEFEHYQSLLGEHHYIIGRKNYEETQDKHDPKKAIVLSRNSNYQTSAPVFQDPMGAINHAKELGEDQLFILGGEQIYQTFMPLIETLYLSIVDFKGEGDHYFPPHEAYAWQCKRSFVRSIDAQTPISWEFFELHKSNPSRAGLKG